MVSFKVYATAMRGLRKSASKRKRLKSAWRSGARPPNAWPVPDLAKRAQQAAEALLEAACRMDVALDLARKDFEALCDAHAQASAVAQTGCNEAMQALRSVHIAVQASAQRLVMPPDQLAITAAPETPTQCAEAVSAIFERSFRA
jgi:hypothetical protein